jgi:hypothetical protein
MKKYNLDYYMAAGGELDDMAWRTHTPAEFFNRVDTVMTRRLN